MSILFRLLGPLDAEVDGRAMDLGHVRQRAVLAILLVEANRTVAPDQLADRIWGDRPPQQATATVYSYVSRLRRSLMQTEGVELVRRAGGYVLLVDPMTVDLHRFRHLAAAARAADGEAALDLFDQALSLWQGEPFAGMDTPWLCRQREAVLRERLAVELERNDLALACGRAAQVLADVQACAAAHPLDERVAAQLMLALYGCGRQADALATYNRVRQRLADDLGADPGPLLRRAHQRILAGDPAAGEPPGADSRAGHRTWLSVPQQLPAAPPSFTGRAAELAELDRAMADGSSPSSTVVISAIGGGGGVGKTWLALRWAHANVSRFPDGQLYVNLRGFDPAADPLPPEVAVRGFLAALGVPDASVPQHIGAQSALFRSLTVGRRMLVILDNARDSSQVVPLLPGSPSCAVLVTSRRNLTGLVAAHGAKSVFLDVLSDDEARDMLAGHLPPDRVAAEPEAVATLVRCCAGLPLAVGIVAARATINPDVPLATLAEELRSASTRLDALDAGELSVNLRAALSCSHAALGDEAAQALAMLGAAPGPDISLPALASLLAVPLLRARALAGELTHSHLLQEYVPGRYRMHDLVRLFAVELAQRARDAAREATNRVLDHYLQTACAAGRALSPGHLAVRLDPPRPGVVGERINGRGDALAWFTAEQQVLVSAVELAAMSGFDRHACRLAASMQVFLGRRLDWPDILAVQRAAVEAARRLADPVEEAYAERGLGIGYIGLRRFDQAQAHLSSALELLSTVDDPECLAQVHRSFARLMAHQGRFAEALAHDEQALELYRRTGDQLGQATSLNALGWHLAHLGEPDRAMVRCQEGLALYAALGDLYGQAITWDSLGYVRHRRGDLVEAVACYERAVELLRDIGETRSAGTTLVDLAETHLSAGDPKAATDALREALSVFEEFGDPAADAVREQLRRLRS